MDDNEFVGLRVHDGDEKRPGKLVITLMQVLSADEREALGDINERDPRGIVGHELNQLHVEHRFEHYLATVAARGLQLGISLASMFETLRRVERAVGDTQIASALPVIGFDVDDVFETVYEQGGSYLRVVEDDYSEHLTAAELQQLTEERQR
jgi:hypothetical protein